MSIILPISGLPDLVTLGETAQVLRLKVSTLRSWRLQGRHLGFVKIGRRIFVRRVDIEALVRAGFRPCDLPPQTRAVEDAKGDV
jgi:hypothetical protein